jgi:hypothetical protein
MQRRKWAIAITVSGILSAVLLWGVGLPFAADNAPAKGPKAVIKTK